MDWKNRVRRVDLPLKRAFVTRASRLPVGANGRWDAVPDDLDPSFLHTAMLEMATTWDFYDPMDAAVPVITGQYVEPGFATMNPGELAMTDPETVRPDCSNGQLQSMVAAHKEHVFRVMKERGLAEHEIPGSMDDNGPEDLLLPRWMLEPKRVDAIEKSIRMQAFHKLPELKRLHESELEIVGANTDVFLETGWHPTQSSFPVPRSVRESPELQRIVMGAKKAEGVLSCIDADDLIESFLVPQAVRDMQCWENPSLTIPWASSDGFFDHDGRRNLDAEEVDQVQHATYGWLVDGQSQGRHLGRQAKDAHDELLWKMRDRDGLYPGIYGKRPSAQPYVQEGNPWGGLPRTGYAPGLIVSPLLLK